jgi:hypothetical protein
VPVALDGPGKPDHDRFGLVPCSSPRSYRGCRTNLPTLPLREGERTRFGAHGGGDGGGAVNAAVEGAAVRQVSPRSALRQKRTVVTGFRAQRPRLAYDISAFGWPAAPMEQADFNGYAVSGA